MKGIVKIPFCRIQCDGAEYRYLKETLESGWLTTGARCFEFEKKMSEKVGSKYACAVNSGTAALHLACEAVGIGRGDQVFVPTMTFTASAEILRYLGADPVFLDVEPTTCLLTPGLLEDGIKRCPHAKAVILVHIGGQAAQLLGEDQNGSHRGILEICRQNGLKLIEDAAHAFPTRHQGRMVGSFGDATCFSFYANKTITTAEGGMLMTDDNEIYERARIMRLHGIDRDVWDRFTAITPGWEYDVVAPGFKYNMPDINAAIGLAQLERAEYFRAERQRCAEYYYESLGGLDDFDMPSCLGPREDHSWHLFWIVLNERSRVSRDLFIEKMNSAGIGTSVHYKPLHRMSYYRDKYRLDPGDYPGAERHWRGAVSLPIYPSLTKWELNYICHTIKTIFSSGGKGLA
jgi:dTDP-4-amino-4,6-dideoxygalactose transaminase